VIADHRQTVLATAEAIAPGWERRRPYIEECSAPVRRWMLDALRPRPGETVLELAAGAGDCGYEAAAVLGGDGTLISTDVSPAMLDVGRRRAAELGVGNVEHRVMDAQRIELGAGSVDGVLCRYGYMLTEDPLAALTETRRVLRRGGRLVLAVWGPPQRNPFFAVVGAFLVERGHMRPPRPGDPSMFALAGEERLRGLLGGAGFGEVRIEEVPLSFAVPDIDEYLAVTADTGGPAGLVLRDLPGGERAAVAARIKDAFAPFASAGGYDVPGVALAAAAT
jgi:SAM-dependent methyltransferase